MREDYGSLALVTHDQGFGDMSFDAEPPELLRHAGAIEPTLDQVRFSVFMNRHRLQTDKFYIYFLDTYVVYRWARD